MNQSIRVYKIFNQHAASYSTTALVQQEIEKRLLERLTYLKLKIHRVLDLGCGPGQGTLVLKNMYPHASVVALDGAEMMLKLVCNQHHACVQADVMRLPFHDQCFDMVFSNQVLHWVEINVLFKEVYRILNHGGCFFFSTVGPDTFKELKLAWEKVDAMPHINVFFDMHHLGDILLHTGFNDPVLDREDLTVHYDTLDALLKSLQQQGVKIIHPHRRRSLMGKGVWRRFKQAYDAFLTPDRLAPLSYEIIYGHAFKTIMQHGSDYGDLGIPVKQIF